MVARISSEELEDILLKALLACVGNSTEVEIKISTAIVRQITNRIN